MVPYEEAIKVTCNDNHSLEWSLHCAPAYYLCSLVYRQPCVQVANSTTRCCCILFINPFSPAEPIKYFSDNKEPLPKTIHGGGVNWKKHLFHWWSRGRMYPLWTTKKTIWVMVLAQPSGVDLRIMHPPLPGRSIGLRSRNPPPTFGGTLMAALLHRQPVILRLVQG